MHCRTSFHADPNNANSRIDGLRSKGDAAGKAAARKGNQDLSDIGMLLEQFDGDGRLAGDHCLMIEGRYGRGARTSGDRVFALSCASSWLFPSRTTCAPSREISATLFWGTKLETQTVDAIPFFAAT